MRWLGIGFGLVVCFSIGCLPEPDDQTMPEPDVTPPGPVQNVEVVAGSDESLTLIWANPPADDLEGVRILKSLVAAPNSEADGDLLCDPCTSAYVDRDTRDGETVFYGLLAYDTSGNDGPIVNVIGQPVDFQAPDPVVNLQKAEGDGEVAFSWELPDVADLVGVEIRHSYDAFPTSLDEGIESCNACEPPFRIEEMVNEQPVFLSVFTVDNVGLTGRATIEATPTATQFLNAEHVKSSLTTGETISNFTQLCQYPQFATSDAIVISDPTRRKVTDLDLRVDVDHGHIFELDFALQHESASGVRTCFQIDNANSSAQPQPGARGLVFDDEASREYSASANFNEYRRFRPPVPLSSFDGLEVTGTWTLLVGDNSVQFQGGDLLNWELTFYYRELQEGESCTFPHILTGGGVSEVVSPLDSEEVSPLGSCIPENRFVNWYRYTLAANESAVSVATNDGGFVVVLFNGVEVACRETLNVVPQDIVGFPGSEICIGIDDLSNITEVTITTQPAACPQPIDLVNPATPALNLMDGEFGQAVRGVDLANSSVTWDRDLATDLAFHDKVTGVLTTAAFTEGFVDYVRVGDDLYALLDEPNPNLVYRVYDGATDTVLMPPQAYGTYTSNNDYRSMAYLPSEQRIFVASMEHIPGSALNHIISLDLAACTTPPCAMDPELGWTMDVTRIRDFAVDDSNFYVFASHDSVTTAGGIYDLWWEPRPGGAPTKIDTPLDIHSGLRTVIDVRDADGDGLADYLYVGRTDLSTYAEICSPTQGLTATWRILTSSHLSYNADTDTLWLTRLNDPVLSQYTLSSFQ